MRAAVRAILDELLARHRDLGRVHLDDMAKVIGTRAVSYDEVDALIAALEAEGLRVGEALNERIFGRMRTVIESARALRVSLGRAPTVDEVAAASGQPGHVVRRALEDARRAAPTRPGSPGS